MNNPEENEMIRRAELAYNLLTWTQYLFKKEGETKEKTRRYDEFINELAKSGLSLPDLALPSSPVPALPAPEEERKDETKGFGLAQLLQRIQNEPSTALTTNGQLTSLHQEWSKAQKQEGVLITDDSKSVDNDRPWKYSGIIFPTEDQGTVGIFYSGDVYWEPGRFSMVAEGIYTRIIEGQLRAAIALSYTLSPATDNHLHNDTTTYIKAHPVELQGTTEEGFTMVGLGGGVSIQFDTNTGRRTMSFKKRLQDKNRINLRFQWGHPQAEPISRALYGKMPEVLKTYTDAIRYRTAKLDTFVSEMDQQEQTINTTIQKGLENLF